MRLRYLLMTLLSWSRAEADEDKTVTVSKLDTDRYSAVQEARYVLYDVNRGEGFNLRRDVHMRVAIGVKKMREAGINAVLVLPPWGGLYHWRDRKMGVRWSELFDLPSLTSFVPSIEFDQFLDAVETPIIDRLVYLQHFQEGWNGEYVMKHEKRPCTDGDRYYEKEDGLWKGWFFGVDGVRARELECVSFQGDSSTFAPMLANYTFKSIFVDRAETVLHADYGGVEYWRARRSMRYSKLLEERAERFISEELGVEIDAPPLTERWEDEKASRSSRGGAYVSVHWRRRDFVTSYGTALPSIKGAAKQISALAAEFKVDKVFLATDAEEKEIEQLRKQLKKITVYTFRPAPDEKLIDGAAAIVEQIICSWSRAFIGSHVSTFSYRIHEDREIRGFPAETTFRRMCADDVVMHGCEQPAKWKIVY